MRLTLTGEALIALAPATDDPAAGEAFRFGAATTVHIPPGTATEFWTASQAASLHTLRVHQMIAAVFITLIVMILGLGAVTA
ncbi:hypothetical protein ACLQ3K_06645 [Tsukamurella sp. DT100]|uniref:hypothetical protein n=1 Tax=Tsukamurella sp. DT100 TaxID=3393415 RepID=UPI003CEB09B5